ncbi:MAG: hypothetical protein Ta2B_30630 [Termitinemataceae bacterium]|nr:MAG: hypothetical protein Ta2B_30630 [Termitinemataceae bacterium]
MGRKGKKNFSKELKAKVALEALREDATLQEFTIIDRKNIDAIEGELKFQTNGTISKETAQSIGKILGPEVIVYGKLNKLGSDYRIIIYATQVEKGTSDIEPRTISLDERLAALLGSGGADAMSLMYL